MRLGLLLLILVAVVFGGGYWQQVFNGFCKVPVYYSVGEVDERFGTTKEELIRIAKLAEKIWEDELARDMFVYAEDGKLPINLIFDERQHNADIEEELREDLDAKEGMSESVAVQYEKLIAEFRNLKQTYETNVVAYETKLKAYNKKVTDWNDQGGVPADQIDDLKKEQQALTAEQQELEARAKELNAIVNQLNLIGAKGNTLITDYNKIVEEYNGRFTGVHEYTQGDHSIEAINIYQFSSEEELVLVLAHEMGHAISLGHVENEQSIMYRLMGEQDIIAGLTSEDLVEYEAKCRQKGLMESFLSLFANLF